LFVGFAVASIREKSARRGRGEVFCSFIEKEVGSSSSTSSSSSSYLHQRRQNTHRVGGWVGGKGGGARGGGGGGGGGAYAFPASEGREKNVTPLVGDHVVDNHRPIATVHTRAQFETIKN